MKCQKLTPFIGPRVPYLPYEDQCDHRLKTKPMHCFVIVHAGDCQGDYDVGQFGEMLEWRGVLWDVNHRDSNDVWRLHDTKNTERVIWCDVGCLTIVPESQVLNASANPIAWLNAWPS